MTRAFAALTLELQVSSAETRAGLAEVRANVAELRTSVDRVDRKVELVIDALADFRREYGEHTHREE